MKITNSTKTSIFHFESFQKLRQNRKNYSAILCPNQMYSGILNSITDPMVKFSRLQITWSLYACKGKTHPICEVKTLPSRSLHLEIKWANLLRNLHRSNISGITAPFNCQISTNSSLSIFMSHPNTQKCSKKNSSSNFLPTKLKSSLAWIFPELFNQAENPCKINFFFSRISIICPDIGSKLFHINFNGYKTQQPFQFSS